MENFPIVESRGQEKLQYIDPNDQLVDMDEGKMPSFKKAIEDMAAKILHCVAIAYRTFEKENVPATEEERAHWSLPEDNFVLLAIVGLKAKSKIQLSFAKNMGLRSAVSLCFALWLSPSIYVSADILMHIHWVNLIMDTLGVLALATEPPTNHLMDRPLVGRRLELWFL
ncbi:hypothetical protein HN51_011675 [Arachis hypogaea]